MSRRVVIKNPDNALYGGLAATFLGLFLLHQAYEARGRQRPKAFKLLGLIE